MKPTDFSKLKMTAVSSPDDASITGSLRSHAMADTARRTRSLFPSRSPPAGIWAGTPTALRRRSTSSLAAVTCSATIVPHRWARAASLYCRRTCGTTCAIPERCRCCHRLFLRRSADADVRQRHASDQQPFAHQPECHRLGENLTEFPSAIRHARPKGRACS